ncbi:MAG TPA: hypothetical protein VH881_17910 [Burkholderiales bacterium]
MTILATLGWIVAIAALVAAGAWVIWLAGRFSSDRLMRCPETGAITLVGIHEATQLDGKGTAPVVWRCELWPERKICARSCLVRYKETEPGFRINLHALRPFGRP